MKIETAERLASAMDRAAAQLSGEQNLKKASSDVTRFLAGLINLMDGFKSYEHVRATFITMKEPSPQSLVLIEASLRFAPRLAKAWMKSRAQDFIAEQQDQKGHPFSIPVDRHWSICLEVSAFELKGLSHAAAKRLVAKCHNVNSRTIHRIWKNRSECPKDGVTIKDVETFLRMEFEQKR